MKLNKRIITVMVCVLSLFLVMVGYLTYFSLFRATEVYKSSYNQRIWENEEKVLRGAITDRNGTVLAESKRSENGQTRKYPYKKLYAHTIGYNSRTYGKTNLELAYNEKLLQTPSVLQSFQNGKQSDEAMKYGATLELTLDHGMTQLAAEKLANDKGSVVVMNPTTGEVYCMYSNPSFDPNEDALVKNWDKLQSDTDAPFFSRATQGRYAPGSTFKVVTAAAAIESGNGEYTVKDEGKILVGGHEYKNSGSKAYGNIDMCKAIKYSSNVYFASIADLIGSYSLEKTAENFYITKKIPFDIETTERKLDFNAMDTAELGATAIGQGKLQISPLNMALVACGIANNGVIMKPYMVNRAYYKTGKVFYETQPEVLSKATDESTAQTIGEYMVECVKGGTGRSAAVRGITVAGKTGTAENERKGKTHAWFICYAPAEDPQIAMCIMKEYSGSGGGSVCAPIAASIIQYASKQGLIK